MQISLRLFLLVFAVLLVGAMLSGQRKPPSPPVSHGWQRETANSRREQIGRELVGMEPGLSTANVIQDGDLSQRRETQLRIAARNQQLQHLLAQQQQQVAQMQAALQQSQRDLANARNGQRRTAHPDVKSD
jgi:hypothetical protein